MRNFITRRGDNNLATCYQYAVQDGNRCKALNIKFYEKIIDLISREGSLPVGSRIAKIVGATPNKDGIHRRVRESLRTGLTRVEVSVCATAFTKYDSRNMLAGKSGCRKIQTFIDKLIANCLNHKSTVSRIYRKLDVPLLLTTLSDSKHNILAVGQGQSWMLNARSVDFQHVIGTRIMYGYD